jgi:hypothetical protein
MDIDLGIALEEFRKVRRQFVQANAVGGGDSDCAGDDVLKFLNSAAERIVRLKDLLAVIVQDLAFAREPELLLAPLDQQGFEESFQRADLLTDCRFGNLVDLCSLREALGLYQIAKDFQALDLH